MATPTRPVQDAIIDPVWGQWVHDAVLNKASIIGTASGPITFSAAGRAFIPASMFGLTAITGILVTASPTNAMAVFNIIDGVGTGTIQINGIYWAWGGSAWNPQPGPVTGNQTLFMFAWGTPIDVGTGRDRPELMPAPDDDRPEIAPHEED